MNIELLKTARIKLTGLTVHILSFYVSSVSGIVMLLYQTYFSFFTEVG